MTDFHSLHRFPVTTLFGAPREFSVTVSGLAFGALLTLLDFSMRSQDCYLFVQNGVLVRMSLDRPAPRDVDGIILWRGGPGQNGMMEWTEKGTVVQCIKHDLFIAYLPLS